MNPVALVVGVTGVTGTPMAEQLLSRGWRVYGISRRMPVLKSGTPLTHFVHLPLDLQEPSSSTALAAQCADVSYVFYSANDQSGDRRVRMMANLLNAVAELKHVTNINLMQGMKYYGANIGPFKTPAKETDPRVAGCAVYYNEEDLVLRRQRNAGWTWTALRPHAVCGYSAANPLNLATVIAIYATIMRETGKNLTFPGSSASFNALQQLVDAELLARAAVHVSTTPGCGNQAYNISNGDMFRWRYMWPVLARFFGVKLGRPGEAPLSHFLAQRQSTWSTIAVKNNLKPLPIEFASRWTKDDYAGHNSRFASEHDIIADTSRLRRSGFGEMMESEEMFIRLFERLRVERVIP